MTLVHSQVTIFKGVFCHLLVAHRVFLVLPWYPRDLLIKLSDKSYSRDNRLTYS